MLFIEHLNVHKFLDWVKDAIILNNRATSAKNRKVRRGQVYRCNFGVGIGSEMRKDRPAVILQNDPANKSSGNTIVAPITHDEDDLPCMVPIAPVYESDGITLKLDGQVNTANLMCVSKARLGDYVSDISSTDMKKIDEALAKTVALMPYYSSLTKKLEDKMQYVNRLKTERNAAQDDLKRICDLVGAEDTSTALLKIKEILDTKNNP